MTTANLISKLNKLGIENHIEDINGFNQDVIFIINGVKFYAGFDIESNIITDYHKKTGYDESNQETRRTFYDNLNQLLRCNKK